MGRSVLRNILNSTPRNPNDSWRVSKHCPLNGVFAEAAVQHFLWPWPPDWVLGLPKAPGRHVERELAAQIGGRGGPGVAGRNRTEATHMGPHCARGGPRAISDHPSNTEPPSSRVPTGILRRSGSEIANPTGKTGIQKGQFGAKKINLTYPLCPLPAAHKAQLPMTFPDFPRLCGLHCAHPTPRFQSPHGFAGFEIANYHVCKSQNLQQVSQNN